MGVPKFFRWISERYPTLSELVKNYQIPEFDNLYLDMNGIIHVCSHPNDFDPHFRISEEKIFLDIFTYIETLFKMIQPRKLFFMAVDGVAPRAKMNQQRGRRFRSAKEAELLEKKAREKGEQLPSEARFDSNCITPGTAFMARLQEQLKYFVAQKVSTDPLWSTIRVILSGHNTPGEGEHKIMDYIRYMKSQPDYDPNTRHCLYGLDADLIMLGMCTHEPYFCLLREEVKFGRRNQQQRLNAAENINFYLLHLSLLRNYLSLEFSALKGKINFPWDLERIIDDWVLMGFLVGNDFIPPLPDMHIASGALPMLYKAYIEVLPSLGGYIQESGNLNLHRFEAYLQYLSKFDVEHFKDVHADIKYMESKTGRRRETKNIRDEDLNELINSTLDILSDMSDASSNDEDYDDRLFRQQFYVHKADYYVNKLEFDSMTPEVLRGQTRVYIEAIQWNLHYYYHGVCSWSWFYPHHYAPYVSDIRDFADLELNYDIGQPFRPFEQLLAVLPAGSRDLLPEPYQKLMTEKESPIIKYYPSEFQTDLNGKQQQWEAVVLIPFIKEDSLLKAMLPIEDQLNDEEKKRNSEGPMLEFHRDPEPQGIVIAPEYFPKIDPSFAKIRPITREQLFIPRDELIKGLCPGVNLDLYSRGFPTLRHIPHTGRLKKAKVKVFDQPSRGENMIIQIIQSASTLSLGDAAKRLLGKTVWVGWPHLQEALVSAVADANELLSEVPMPFSPKEWSLQKQSLREEFSNRLGIDLGEVRILVYARPMIGKRYIFGQRGRITVDKQWTTGNVPYPLQVVITELPVINDTITEYASIQQIYPVGCDVFLLTPEFYGVRGEVLPTKEKNKIFVQANIPSNPNLDPIRELHQRYLDGFVTGQEAARRVGTTPFLLSRLTGTIYAQSESDKKTNLGLNLKFNRRNEEVVGFTRKENNSAWLYSKDCVIICKEYVEKFPEVVKCLSKHSSEDVLAESEVFESKERLQDAVTWLRGLPCTLADRVPCGTELLCFEAIQELERIITQSDADWRKKPPVIKRVHVQPSQVFRPKLQMGQVCPDPSANYRLLDRVNVVGIKFGSSVGQFGTVIAVRRNSETTICDIILDNGIRCNSLPPWSMINLSYGRRLSQPPTLQTKIHSSPWNNNLGAHSPHNNQNVQKTQTPPSLSGIPNTMHLHAPPQPPFQILQRPQHNNQAAQSTVVLRQLLKIGSPSTSATTTLAPQSNSLSNPNTSAMSQNKPRPRLNLPPPPPQQWVQTKGDQRPRGPLHPNPSPNNRTPISPNEARFVPLQAIRAQQRKKDNQQISPDAPNHLIPVEAAPSCAPISLAAAATTQLTPNLSTSHPSTPETSESSSLSFTSTVNQGNIPIKHSQSPKHKSHSHNPTQPNVVRKRRPRIAANFSQKFVD